MNEIRAEVLEHLTSLSKVRHRIDVKLTSKDGVPRIDILLWQDSAPEDGGQEIILGFGADQRAAKKDAVLALRNLAILLENTLEVDLSGAIETDKVDAFLEALPH